MLALALAVPALALEESDVEAAVSSSSREAVTGNVLVWFLCAVGFLKVSQKIDSFMASIGVNVGHTGGSMLGEAMVAFKGVSLAAGMAGKVVGNFADRASSRAGAAASGSSGFLQGGLAGVVSRKITNDAVRTATQTTQKASSSTMPAAHQATERTVNAERQAASVVHQAKQTRSESASQKSQMGVTHQQVASSTRTTSVSSLRRESQHSVGLGGRIFTNSMLEGGRFANDVIGMVAAGDLHSTGSITGEFASQALSSYMGITAQGDAAPQISYSNIEIGGGRITGTEYSPEHPEGISFGMYHTGQYAAPDGEHQKVFSADGVQWYKQYAVDTVIKKPFTAPDGEIDYLQKQGRIVQRGEYYRIPADAEESIDHGLSKAVWVLTDFMEQVEYHSVSDYPAKIIFFADGEVYEIIYAEPGKEQLINQMLSTVKEVPPKYIVLIEQPEQIAEIHTPNTSGYCTVSSGGEVQYYQIE